MPKRFAGIDGCRAGWLCVGSDESLNLEPPRLFASLDEAAFFFKPCHSIWIDMPLGLKSSGEHERECDRLARRLLPGRGSSVFPVPVRRAVYAEDYDSACRLNAVRTGRRLSRQVWNLCPKIREADRFLRRSAASRRRFKESHPELCFKALGAEQGLLSSKKTAEGKRRRIKLLKKYVPRFGRWWRRAAPLFRRAEAAPDDLLDAAVLAVSSARAGTSGLVSLPFRITRDPEGIPMRIVFPGGKKELLQ